MAPIRRGHDSTREGELVLCPKFQVLLCRPDAPEVDEECHRRNIDSRLPKVQQGSSTFSVYEIAP